MCIKMVRKLVDGILWIKMRWCKSELKWNFFSGGGSYDKEGNVIKIGKWIEISDGYSMNSTVTYDGEYRDGQKIGRWNTLFNKTVM